MTEVDVCRHCGREDVAVSVLIPAHLSHTGKVRRENKPIDACIADLVRRLNAEGDEPVTCGSCCGHGEGPGVISLADGRELQIPTVGGAGRSERVLRTSILDVLALQPGDMIGGRLRQALIESREPGEHPEDKCEECRDPFEPWTAWPEDWERVTGRSWGGPILCKSCFDRRLVESGAREEPSDDE